MPWQTAVPIGIPKTGFPTELMAKVAARNITAAIKGEPPASHKDFGDMAAVCMMDAGANGVMILADHMLPPRKAAVMIPGPQVHAMKVAFEKYYLWKSRHGYVRCPDSQALHAGRTDRRDLSACRFASTRQPTCKYSAIRRWTGSRSCYIS